MSNESLQKLVEIGQLKAETFSQSEFDGLVQSGSRHTLDMDNELWRVLDQAYRKRNLAEYEGYFEIDEQLTKAVIRVESEIDSRLDSLGKQSGKPEGPGLP